LGHFFKCSNGQQTFSNVSRKKMLVVCYVREVKIDFAPP
jgi:hypothetical protein